LSTLQAAGYPSTTSTILSVSSKVEPLIRDDRGSMCELCLCSFPASETKLPVNELMAGHSLCRVCQDMLSEMGDVASEVLRIVDINKIL
jgi:hypothetical protein